MNETIDINSLQSEIEKILEEYGDQCIDVVNEAIEDTTKKALSRIKKDSPRKTGAYAKSWKRKIIKERTKTSASVYNEEAWLVHLLENGHVIRNGGRITKGGFVSPKTHVGPVNEWAQDYFITKVKEGLEDMK